MPKRVLNVGQCSPDHSSISRFLQSHFDVQIERADFKDEALETLGGGTYDLVLVNRKLDADESDGLAVIRAIKADPELTATPVMLVSNYADAQKTAVAAGAEPGFGKSELGDADVVERLRPFLR